MSDKKKGDTYILYEGDTEKKMGMDYKRVKFPRWLDCGRSVTGFHFLLFGLGIHLSGKNKYWMRLVDMRHPVFTDFPEGE